MLKRESVNLATEEILIMETTAVLKGKGLKTTPCSECVLNTLAIDEPLEYARLYLKGNLQMRIDAEDSLELLQ